jgi:twitching motility protein PilJ
MTTAKPFSYSENPNHSNGASVPPSPASAKARLKTTKRNQVSPPPKPTPELDKSNPKTTPEPQGSNKARTLRSRLLLTLLPVTLLPLAIVSAVNYWVTQDRVYSEEKASLEKEALVGSDLSTAFIAELRMNAELVSINPMIQQALQAADQEVATKNLTQVPTERLETYYNSSKLLLPNAGLNTYLQQVSGKAGLEEIFVTNRDGFNVAYSNVTSDLVQSDEAWWQGAYKDGLFVEPPEYDESAEAYVLALTTAIQDPTTAEVAGVIKSGASLAGLNDRLAEFLGTLKQSNQIQVVAPATGQLVASFTAREDGQAVATPTSELVDQTATGGETITKIAAALQAAAATESSPEQLVATLKESYNVQALQVERLTRQDGDVLMAQFNDGTKHYAMATVPNLQWVAIASIDTTELKEAGYEILNWSLMLGGILGAAAIGIILYLSRRVSAPINQLSETANQMAQGDLNVIAIEAGTLETQQLASTFNNLVKQVKNLLGLQQDETERVQSLAAIAQAKNDNDIQIPLNEFLGKVRLKLAADRVVVYRFKPDLDRLHCR